MKIKLTKLTQKINELNCIIDFVEVNELDLDTKSRYILVLRHQTTLTIIDHEDGGPELYNKNQEDILSKPQNIS